MNVGKRVSTVFLSQYYPFNNFNLIFQVTVSWFVSVFHMPSFLFKYQICQEQRLFYSLLYLNLHSNDWHIVNAPHIFVERLRFYYIKCTLLSINIINI